MRPHDPICDLPTDARSHGEYCVSRPIARQAIASSEAGKAIDVTVDLAVKRSDRHGQRMVRVIGEPPNIQHRFVAIMPSGTARQLAAALLVAAGQAEELEHDVTRSRPLGR